MSYKLYVDIARDPPDKSDWIVVRSPVMAIIKVLEYNIMPSVILLGDLEEQEHMIKFLSELQYLWEKWGLDTASIPEYEIRTEDKIAAKKITVFMDEWKEMSK